MKHIILTLTLIIFTSIHILSQENFENRIEGKYTGDSKKGVAHGNGKSVGIDTFEGKFRKGIPQGKGTYIFGEEVEFRGTAYKKGDKYVGSFSDGLFIGEGKVISANKKTSCF